MPQLDQSSFAKLFSYRRSDLNRQELPRRILSALRLPIPPRLHGLNECYTLEARHQQGRIVREALIKSVILQFRIRGVRDVRRFP